MSACETEEGDAAMAVQTDSSEAGSAVYQELQVISTIDTQQSKTDVSLQLILSTRVNHESIVLYENVSIIIDKGA